MEIVDLAIMQKKIAPFVVLPMFFVFPIVIWVSWGNSGEWNNSFGFWEFISGNLFLPLFAASLLVFPAINLLAKRLRSTAPASPAIPIFALSELPLIFGFAFAFANKNTLFFIPFWLLGAACFAYAYSITRQTG